MSLRKVEQRLILAEGAALVKGGRESGMGGDVRSDNSGAVFLMRLPVRQPWYFLAAQARGGVCRMQANM